MLYVSFQTPQLYSVNANITNRAWIGLQRPIYRVFVSWHCRSVDALSAVNTKRTPPHVMSTSPSLNTLASETTWGTGGRSPKNHNAELLLSAKTFLARPAGGGIPAIPRAAADTGMYPPLAPITN